MAKIKAMPAIEIINRLAGVVDFYMWKDIPCARKWPKYVKPTMPGQIARNDIFTDAVAAYNLLTDDERIFWRVLAVGHDYSGRDLFISQYLKTH